MPATRKTRSSVPSVSVKGIPIDGETPVTGRTKTLLKTKADQPRRSGRTRIREAKEIPTLNLHSDGASSQVPLQTPQAVYDFDDAEKSNTKPSTTAATQKAARKRKQNAGPPGRTKGSCVIKKPKVSPAHRRPTTRVKEISPILPDQARVTTVLPRSKKGAKRAPPSPSQAAPTRKRTVTSIQAWEDGQEDFVNPLLSSSTDSLSSPPIVPVKKKKRRAKTKTSTPASAADGGRIQPCPTVEPLNLTESSLLEEAPHSVDVIDTESGLFTDYSSAYTVSHMSEGEDREPPQHESKPVQDEADLISNKDDIVAYKAKKTKRPKGRYSESKLDAWAEKMNAQFEEVEKFELSIDD